MSANPVTCIIGMHRSGTSMVARLLQQAGLYLGPDDRLLGPDSANPEGHFEHTGFLEINNALLQQLGGSWDIPPKMEPGWELDPSVESIRANAKALIATFPGNSLWGWKEPRTTILLPFWKSIISNLRFVICVRSPLDVAQSLASRNKLALDYGICLWNRYMHKAIQDTQGYPVHFAIYEEFFGNGVAETRRLLKFCGLDFLSNQSELESIICGNLRHHDTAMSELLDESSVDLHSKLLYIGLRTLSACVPISTAGDGGSSSHIGQFLKCLDEFHNQGQVGQLKTALSQKTCELREKGLEIIALKHQLSELRQHADRLQKFSDAVRQTWAYRLYRKLIKPIQSK